MAVYFTSDLHFDHHNLVDFRKDVHNIHLPNTKAMNEWIVQNHNEMVRKKNDIVWILGDVSWSLHGLEYLKLMNGRKRLILGNHDTEGRGLSIDAFLPYFESIHGVHKKYGFVMSHCPIHPCEIQEKYRWSHNVHGHIHHPDRVIKDPKYTNVNIDVEKIMNQQKHFEFNTIDHLPTVVTFSFYLIAI